MRDTAGQILVPFKARCPH